MAQLSFVSLTVILKQRLSSRDSTPAETVIIQKLRHAKESVNMQQTCPYCGDPDIASCGAKTGTDSNLFTCSRCGLSFFDYQIPGSQDDQTVSGSGDDIPGEEETLTLAVSLLQKKGYAEACQALDECPFPRQHPLAMNFLRLIGELGKPGILTETNLKLLYADKAEHNFTGVLDVLIDNLRHIDSLLPKDDPQQLYAAYRGLYEALSALAVLPIEYYAESTVTILGQVIDTAQYEKRYHRTDIWIKRAIAAGILAQRMENLHGDSRCGDKYREMSASLLSKCAEYSKKAPSLPLLSGVAFADTIADRITDYIVMNRQEKKIRRQLQAKIKDEKAPIELIYQPQDRDTVSFWVHAIPITAIVLFVLAAFALY